MKTIQVSAELWNEMVVLAIKILRQPIDSAEAPERAPAPTILPRHFMRGPLQAERRQSVRVLRNKLELAYPEEGILQTWELPSKSDREAIRKVREEAVAFGEKHGASEGQLKAIMKALTENGYYLVGPRRSGPRSSGTRGMIKGFKFKVLSAEMQAALKGKSPEEIAELLAKLPPTDEE